MIVCFYFRNISMKILLTGPPGVGKTSLVKYLSEQLDHCAGFYTEEIRDTGTKKRTGFDVVSLGSERRASLARVNTPVKGPRVGQYTVTLAEFESLALNSLSAASVKNSRVLLIDEIGKMENFSSKFQSLVREIFFSDSYQGNIIVATIPVKFESLGLVKEIVNKSEAEIIEVTVSNRDELRNILLGKLSQ